MLVLVRVANFYFTSHVRGHSTDDVLSVTVRYNTALPGIL